MSELQELNNLPEPVRLDLAALLNPWRPIETAPKDGKPILCCFKGQFAWMFFVCDANGSDTSRAGYFEPTHWLTLPAPPSEDKWMPFEQKGQTMTLTTDNPQHPFSRAQHEALMAAVKALKRYHHPPSKIDAPDCPCCNCEGERAIAALRAVGILEGE